MQSRRNLFLAASVLTAAGISTRTFADDDKTVDYLLVQTSKGMTFDKATNTTPFFFAQVPVTVRTAPLI